ncbi:unnamed protein product [Gadus morhua 'NCC']
MHTHSLTLTPSLYQAFIDTRLQMASWRLCDSARLKLLLWKPTLPYNWGSWEFLSSNEIIILIPQVPMLSSSLLP